jgi:predicted nicotinamide N-methyase
VWDAAATLADDLARDGAAVALSRWEGMRARGAEDRDAARHTARTVNVTRGDARRWWRNKVVVELGAGLGAASLAAAALGARALATDGDEAVVTLCVENAVANEEAVVSTATRLASFLDNDDGARSENNTEETFSPQTPKCARLLWGDDGDARLALEWVRAVFLETNRESNSSNSYPDAILLADVVYGENASVWRSLVKTLKTLSGPNTVIVLSHARRGRGEAFAQFEEIARDAGFEVEAAETKSDAKDGLLAVTVTYVMRRF